MIDFVIMPKTQLTSHTHKITNSGMSFIESIYNYNIIVSKTNYNNFDTLVLSDTYYCTYKQYEQNDPSTSMNTQGLLILRQKNHII